MALQQEKSYTEEDYYNLPEDVRAELIDVKNAAARLTGFLRLCHPLTLAMTI